jgi:alpha-L-fucosidase
MIKAYADSKGIPYADYYAVLVDGQKGLKQEYQKDSIHPNAAGYLAMETVIQPIIERVLK